MSDEEKLEEEEEEEEDTFILTDDQAADFKDAFKKFDAAGAGEIPTSELGTVMRMLGHNLKDEELEECIKIVDADGGGSVDIDEFLELMRTKTKEAQDEVEVFTLLTLSKLQTNKMGRFWFWIYCKRMEGTKVKEAFRILDKDGKGEIHTDVIKEILQKLDDNLTDADLNEMIAEIDEDGSGWVDYDEFKGLMLG